MKILIATDNYPPRYDGISRFLQEVIPELADKHDVRVVAPDFGPTDDPWTVTKLPVVRFRVGDYHPAGLHFIKILREVRKADAVFLQTLGSIGFLSLIAAKMTGKKILLYTHSIEWELVPRAIGGTVLRRFLPDMIKRLDRWMYNSINLLLVPSSGISETLYWNKIENKRVIVHLGVDTHKFAPSEDKEAAKRKVGIDPEAIVIGYHGRLAREKDLKTLLRAYLRIRSQTDKKLHLLVVGDGLREIRSMLEREDVTVTGFVEDVVPYLHAMDIYSLCSLTETSSLSVMEAMSCGLAVCSTPVGHIKDYIKTDTNGLLFPEHDNVLLAKHFETLMDGRIRARLGRAARKTIQSRFGWEQTREQIIKVFDQL